MSITTTWTSTSTDRPLPRQRAAGHAASPGPRPAWDCANCSLLNAGTRKRCTDCGTTRD